MDATIKCVCVCWGGGGGVGSPGFIICVFVQLYFR